AAVCLVRSSGPPALLPRGGVELVRAGVDLAPAGVDSPVGGLDAARVAGPAHVVAGRAPRRADRVVAPARALGAADVSGPQLALRRLELLDEPGMEPRVHVV